MIKITSMTSAAAAATIAGTAGAAGIGGAASPTRIGWTTSMARIAGPRACRQRCPGQEPRGRTAGAVDAITSAQGCTPRLVKGSVCPLLREDMHVDVTVAAATIAVITIMITTLSVTIIILIQISVMLVTTTAVMAQLPDIPPTTPMGQDYNCDCA